MNLAEPKIEEKSFLPSQLKGHKPFINLRLRSLERTLPLMRELAFARSLGEITNHLLVVQHPPVYTLGRGIQRTVRNKNKAIPRESLLSLRQRLPYPVVDVERGGGITFHDPGQFIGYPIIQLNPQKGFGVHEYLRNLEFMLIQILQYIVPHRKFVTNPDATGIWVDGKKVASIGIAVKKWVAYHGFAINLTSEISAFKHINPCGLDPESITNLSLVAGKIITHKEILDSLLPLFSRYFLNRSNYHGF